MAINRGFSGLNSLMNSADPTNEILSNLDILNSKFINGRVKDIILSNKHPLFNDYGGWNGLGTIFFDVNSIAQSFKVCFTKAILGTETIIVFDLSFSAIQKAVRVFPVPQGIISFPLLFFFLKK